jgi:hypothetical protein
MEISPQTNISIKYPTNPENNPQQIKLFKLLGKHLKKHRKKNIFDKAINR